MKEVHFLPEVSGDLAEAMAWYEEMGGRELADRFIENFYLVLPGVSRNAEMHRKLFREYCRIVLRPFPYKLYYRVAGNSVVVALVIHCARDPRLVHKLLNQRQQEI